MSQKIDRKKANYAWTRVHRLGYGNPFYYAGAGNTYIDLHQYTAIGIALVEMEWGSIKEMNGE
jgi:hypothetical protein